MNYLVLKPSVVQHIGLSESIDEHLYLLHLLLWEQVNFALSDFEDFH